MIGRVLPTHLSDLLVALVSRDQAAYEPPKQTRSVLLYWRTPDEWAQVLHDWVCISPDSSHPLLI